MFCLLVMVFCACSNAPHHSALHAPHWQDAQLAPVRNPQPIVQSQPRPAEDPPRSSMAGKYNGATEIEPAPLGRARTAPHAETLAPRTLVAPHETWVPLQRWSRSTGLVQLTSLGAAPLPGYALHSSNGVFTVNTGSQLARWDELDVRLGFAPQLIDEQPYVHTLDLNKVLEPLLVSPPVWGGTERVIVIDPGHGGENAGTMSVLGEHAEKEFTLDWALRLQHLLWAQGWQAFLTRSNDIDLALSNRVAIADFHKAAVFLSLHFNSAAPNETEAGLETYCLTPAGMPSTLIRGFEDDAAQVYPNNAFDAQNLQLAVRIHRALLRVNGQRDRGVRHARFPGILRNQQRPAVLIEGGYLSNPQEAGLIAEPAYRQKLAEALAGALDMLAGS